MRRHLGILGELSAPKQDQEHGRNRSPWRTTCPYITRASSLQGVPEAEGCYTEASASPPHSS